MNKVIIDIRIIISSRVIPRVNRMKSAFKADHWSKNENAYQIMRIRSKNCRKLYVICMGRNCHRINSTPVYGTRALKKSKPVSSHKTKMFRRSFINPYFIDHKNGESNLD